MNKLKWKTVLIALANCVFISFLVFWGIEREVKEMGDSSHLLGSLNSICRVLLLIVVVAFSVIELSQTLKGKKHTQLQNYINRSAPTQLTKQRLDAFLNTASYLHGIYYDEHYICGQSKMSIVFGETYQLVWIYKRAEPVKFMGIRTYNEDYVCFVFTDGEVQELGVDDEVYADKILAKIEELCPRAIVGYSKELQDLFEEDFQGFMDLKYNK